MAAWTSPQLIEAFFNRRIDSVFFYPTYINSETQILKCNIDKLGQLGNFIPGPFGSAFRVQDYDFKLNFRYIRGRDVKPFFLLDDDNRYIPGNDFNRLIKYSVLPQDLMISVVGTLGNVAICTENDTPAIFSCKSTIFRTKTVDPYYLLGYLNSHYGRTCLVRRQRGAIQTGLNIEDLRTVPIPRFKAEHENYISENIKLSHSALIQTKDPYFLSTLLNTQFGQLQMDLHTRGTSGQLHLYPRDARKILIWAAPKSLQNEMRELLLKAASYEKESRDLLEQAKSRVEQLIEEATRA